MSKTLLFALACCLVEVACKRSQPTAAGAADPPSASEARIELPETIGLFRAGPLERQGGGVYRLYVRGDTRITVTVSRLPMSANQYEAWLRTSREGFPQAALELAPDRGNGFYQCDGKDHCDLLVQLRSGVHIEIRGGGAATRDDVNTIARALPLRALAADPAPSAPAVSFRLDVAPVLASSCAAADGCHGADRTRRVSMDLRDGAAYLSLVGRPSQMRPTALLVDPGHPAKSFLVDKLTRHLAATGEGRPMPLDPQTGSTADPSPVEGFVWKTLVPWIAQGAANN